MLKDYKLVLLVSLVSYFQSNAMRQELMASEQSTTSNHTAQKVYVYFNSPSIVLPGKKVTDEEKKEIRENKFPTYNMSLTDKALFEVTFSGAMNKLTKKYGELSEEQQPRWLKHYPVLGLLEFTIKPKKNESVRRSIDDHFKNVSNIHTITRDYGELRQIFENIKKNNSKDTGDKDDFSGMLNDIEEIDIDDTTEK